MGGFPGDENPAREANVKVDLGDGGFKGAVMDFSILFWKP